eukprot:6008867-Alexandrium_andersonii.AAC.1
MCIRDRCIPCRVTPHTAVRCRAQVMAPRRAMQHCVFAALCCAVLCRAQPFLQTRVRMRGCVREGERVREREIAR